MRHFQTTGRHTVVALRMCHPYKLLGFESDVSMWRKGNRPFFGRGDFTFKCDRGFGRCRNQAGERHFIAFVISRRWLPTRRFLAADMRNLHGIFAKFRLPGGFFILHGRLPPGPRGVDGDANGRYLGPSGKLTRSPTPSQHAKKLLVSHLLTQKRPMQMWKKKQMGSSGGM